MLQGLICYDVFQTDEDMFDQEGTFSLDCAIGCLHGGHPVPPLPLVMPLSPSLSWSPSLPLKSKQWLLLAILPVLYYPQPYLFAVLSRKKLLQFLTPFFCFFLQLYVPYTKPVEVGSTVRVVRNLTARTISYLING